MRSTPPPPQSGRDPYNWLTVGLLAVLAGVVALTFRDYGMSWDELWYIRYGRDVLAFLGTFGADRGAVTPGRVPYDRGATFSTLVEALASISPLDTLATRRLATAATGIGGMVAVWRTARLVAGPAAGFWALLLLALVPAYYGHMFINPVDLPFAVGYIWTLYFALKILCAFPAVRRGAYVGLGVALGFTLGCRLSGGVLVFGIFGLMALARLALDMVLGPADRRSLWRAAGRACVWITVAVLIALAVMTVCWPKVLLEPGYLWRASSIESSFPKHEQVLFLGEHVWSDALPWTYWTIYMLVKLPVVFILALIGGVTVTLVAARGWARRRDWSPLIAQLTLVTAWALPLLIITVKRSPDYDGIRHFLFTVPPMACLGGLFIGGAISRLRQLHWATAMAIALAAVLGLAPVVKSMAELHPFQYIYYNELIGGVRGARGRFAMDYWVTSFGQAVADLARHVRDGQLPPAQGQTHYRVVVCGSKKVAAVYLDQLGQSKERPLLFEIVDDPRQAEFYLSTTKFQCHERVQAPIVSTVSRQGVPLAVVRQLRPLPDHRPSAE